jgi:hypothetical protein
MTLLPAHDIRQIIRTFPGLAQDRKEFLFEFMASLSPVELDQMLECDSTPAEEVAFIRACCGLEPLDRPLMKSL